MNAGPLRPEDYKPQKGHPGLRRSGRRSPLVPILLILVSLPIAILTIPVGIGLAIIRSYDHLLMGAGVRSYVSRHIKRCPECQQWLAVLEGAGPASSVPGSQQGA